ncbi:MAG: hypothetical protein PHV42_03755 [Candidatus Pacebacteria bacterium]|nr:hypothetical protein [Candidatus Paceibacterota bacterium]
MRKIQLGIVLLAVMALVMFVVCGILWYRFGDIHAANDLPMLFGMLGMMNALIAMQLQEGLDEEDEHVASIFQRLQRAARRLRQSPPEDQHWHRN